MLTIQYTNTNIQIQKYKYTILNLKTVMIIANEDPQDDNQDDTESARMNDQVDGRLHP